MMTTGRNPVRKHGAAFQKTRAYHTMRSSFRQHFAGILSGNVAPKKVKKRRGSHGGGSAPFGVCARLAQKFSFSPQFGQTSFFAPLGLMG